MQQAENVVSSSPTFRVLSARSTAMDSSSLNSSEFQNFLEQEKQKAMMNELVGKLTDVCWDKCITGTPGSKFSSSETTCLTNCAQRFLDMSALIMRALSRHALSCAVVRPLISVDK